MHELSSPHTRGSSPDGRTRGRPDDLFPVHAGVIPAPAGVAPGPHPLPHKRGGHPMTMNEIRAKARSSPHARGSSRRAAQRFDGPVERVDRGRGHLLLVGEFGISGPMLGGGRWVHRVTGSVAGVMWARGRLRRAWHVGMVWAGAVCLVAWRVGACRWRPVRPAVRRPGAGGRAGVGCVPGTWFGRRCGPGAARLVLDRHDVHCARCCWLRWRGGCARVLRPC